MCAPVWCARSLLWRAKRTFRFSSSTKMLLTRVWVCVWNGTRRKRVSEWKNESKRGREGRWWGQNTAKVICPSGILMPEKPHSPQPCIVFVYRFCIITFGLACASGALRLRTCAMKKLPFDRIGLLAWSLLLPQTKMHTHRHSDEISNFHIPFRSLVFPFSLVIGENGIQCDLCNVECRATPTTLS